MPNAIVWLHGDSLSSVDPALLALPEAPAIFVFDEPFLQQARLSFKRLFFLYESALEALEGRNGFVYRGEVVETIRTFCLTHAADEIHVTTSVAPRFNRYVQQLRRQFKVVVYQPQPLVHWRGAAPRRFSAFWRRVETEALRPTGSGPQAYTEQSS
ncbi:hypothetical protein [Candidatus Chloroploca asiatica]|uniref:Photolyase/cryptochrome alpha/beta domain-containing protein n=1 Tax=Candidatus Chloroploca asiatica TaxID=1506545 RepID=A0A2H3KI23_9CHLR|nr:hypothetical protein [Candidatus Chloroploca asiatica]PDV97468.1 hypothetical protein A9Q02_18175 [Candidatus Chloroploca asiatica]